MIAMAQTLSLPIQNMTCGGCAARVNRALAAVDGAFDVTVNLANETALFHADTPGVLEDALGALDRAGYPARTQEMQFRVSGLSCASCVGRLQNAVHDVDGVINAQVNLVDETATLTYLPTMTDLATLQEAGAKAGYPLRAIEAQDAYDRSGEKKAEAEQHRRVMLVSAALTIPVFILEMGGHLIPAFHHLIARTIGIETSWMIQAALTTAVLIGPGRTFFTNGFPALWHRAPNMNSLVALGAGSAWMFSMIALLFPMLLPQGTRAVYFEAAAVIVTLILLGRWFEARAKGQTGAAVQALVGLQPKTAWLAKGDDWIEVPIADLRVGDHFLLKPGERVPTDARVLTGIGHVDESMLTGEAMQVAKAIGDPLTGGSVNGAASLTCEVTRIGQDTTLSQIIRMVRDAQGARLPIQALVDQITLWFVPAVMGVAALTIAIWLIFGPSPTLSYALVAGVSVLIIACPCAMGLATPTSIMVGTGRAAELGVLFRKGEALQSLGDVSVIALDKTGTLTQGRPMLTTFDSIDADSTDKSLALIAALEVRSEHPVAHAIMSAAKKKNLTLSAATDIEIHPGQGISGVVDGNSIAVGTTSLMAGFGANSAPFNARADELRKKGQTALFAQINGQVAALIAVSDPLRPTSKDVVTALRTQGLKVAIISGDSWATTQAVADDLGIDAVVAEVMPDGKTEALQTLRAQYGKVAFVGDGINDAPALAEADVGIAIGTGTDVAIETADVVLMSDDLRGVTHALDVSRHTLRNIKQNLVWAFGYNTALIPVAAGALYPTLGVMLSPGLAAGAMAFSSVFVLGNALRLRRIGGTS